MSVSRNDVTADLPSSSWMDQVFEEVEARVGPKALAAFRLRHGHDYSFGRIADAQGTSRSTAHYRVAVVQRAIDELTSSQRAA